MQTPSQTEKGSTDLASPTVFQRAYAPPVTKSLSKCKIWEKIKNLGTTGECSGSSYGDLFLFVCKVRESNVVSNVGQVSMTTETSTNCDSSKHMKE
jgi:hypothetical protein